MKLMDIIKELDMTQKMSRTFTIYKCILNKTGETYYSVTSVATKANQSYFNTLKSKAALSLSSEGFSKLINEYPNYTDWTVTKEAENIVEQAEATKLVNQMARNDPKSVNLLAVSAQKNRATPTDIEIPSQYTLDKRITKGLIYVNSAYLDKNPKIKVDKTKNYKVNNKTYYPVINSKQYTYIVRDKNTDMNTPNY